MLRLTSEDVSLEKAVGRIGWLVQPEAESNHFAGAVAYVIVFRHDHASLHERDAGKLFRAGFDGVGSRVQEGPFFFVERYFYFHS